MHDFSMIHLVGRLSERKDKEIIMSNFGLRTGLGCLRSLKKFPTVLASERFFETAFKGEIKRLFTKWLLVTGSLREVVGRRELTAPQTIFFQALLKEALSRRFRCILI